MLRLCFASELHLLLLLPTLRVTPAALVQNPFALLRDMLVFLGCRAMQKGGYGVGLSVCRPALTVTGGLGSVPSAEPTY